MVAYPGPGYLFDFPECRVSEGPLHIQMDNLKETELSDHLYTTGVVFRRLIHSYVFPFLNSSLTIENELIREFKKKTNAHSFRQDCTATTDFASYY